jgi:outer membrane receptor protein involved in Fe transport
MKTQKRFSMVALTISSVIAAASSVAQSQQPAREQDLQEFIVTARAGIGELTKAEVSYAATSLDADRLRFVAPLSTAEVFKSVPGFWVEASGGEASNNVRSRGIPTDGYSSVTIQEDGLTIQHDGGLGWLNADQSFRLDETIGRVEAVRGGPAAIFAANSPGGVVNFITRRPSEKAEGLVKVQLGDYDMYRTDFYYGAPLTDSWDMSVGGFFRSDDGVRSPGFRQNQGGQFRVAIGHDFADGRIDVNFKHIDDNVGFLLPIPLTVDSSADVAAISGFDANFGTLAGPDNRLLSFMNVNGPYAFDLRRGTDVKLTQLTAKFDLGIGDGWRLRNIARLRDSEITRNGLFPTGNIETARARLASLRNAAQAAYPGADLRMVYATSGEVFDLDGANGNGLVISGNLLTVAVPLREFTNDLRISKKFDLGGMTHDFTMGGYVADYSYDYDRYMATANLELRDQARRVDVVAVGGNGAIVGKVTDNGILRYGSLFDNASVEARSTAVYLADEWKLNDALRLDVGVRYEQIDFSGAVEGKKTVDLGVAGTLADNQVITGTGQFSGFDRTYDQTSFTLGVNYQLSEGLGVFGRVTDTGRLPSPSEFQGSVGDTVRTDIVVTPIMMLEAGIKWQSATYALYATAFQSTFEGVRFTDNVFNTATNSFTTRVGYADTKTLGVEIEGNADVGAVFYIGGAVTWQQPEYESFTFTNNVGGKPVVITFSGNQLIRVPEVSARLNPGIKLLGGRLRAELDAEYYSKRFADAANSQSLPAYEVLGANVTWAVTDQMTVGFHGVNLTNEIGLTEGNPRAGQFVSGEAGSQFYTARPILGRSYRLSATYRF